MKQEQGQWQVVKEQMQDKEQDQQKFLIEIFNILHNIRHKYESNQRIASQLDLSLKHQFSNDKFSSIYELVNMIADITNILNFEIKNLELKDG